jgi:hypothetical protein
VKRTAFEQLEHEREASRETGCGETPKSLALAQAMLHRAEFEHRRIPGTKVKPAVFDFGEVADELGQHPAPGPEHRFYSSKELFVGR